MTADARGLAQTMELIVGSDNVQAAIVIGDASGLQGSVPIAVYPGTAEEVRDVVAWAYGEGISIIPVGGCSGYAGGVVSEGGEKVLAVGLRRLTRVRSLDPLLWRMEVEAGVTTAHVARLARENGLMFPPDPGAAEQSQIGGNLATNAGGPHAFKYGVTSQWVTGIEAVIAPGELVRFGGPIRKDAAGYDLRGLMIGSEGTLGIITAAWLRLMPAPTEVRTIVSPYGTIAEGCDAIHAVLGSGVFPAALEFFEGASMTHAPPPFIDVRGAGFMVLCEAESPEACNELLEALGSEARIADAREVWRWRGGVSIAVRAARGEKLSEDIAVPLDCLEEAIEQVLAIGACHALEACSWGHAGDGNLHATFMFDPTELDGRARADAAARDVFALARKVGGSVSGEHGLGVLKRGELVGQWNAAAINAHESIKQALDPRGLFNPGKKQPRLTRDDRRQHA